MHMIILRRMNRHSPVKLGSGDPSTCLWGLSEDELSGYGAVVTQELQSGDSKLISNYLAKIPPGNNQTFSDPTKVFKLWDWAQCVNIGIAIDHQLYAHHWPYSYKALLTPKDFFAQKEELFKIHLGQDHFFSSGAIVVYRH